MARPLNEQDMDASRVEVERIAGARALGGLSSRRLAAGSVSDLVHVNRVQGLALGAGAVVGIGGSRAQLRPSIGYGTSDRRVTGGLSATVGQGATQLTVGVSRRIRDLSDLPVIAPVTNSILSQESGDDHGDYVLLNTVGLGLRHRISGRTSLRRRTGRRGKPVRGVRRLRPTGPTGPTPRSARERAGGPAGAGAGQRRNRGAPGPPGRLSLEGGEGASDYLRVTAEGRWLVSLGASELLTRAYLGAGTDGLPPHRTFVLGGRGTLAGEPFRAYGGRTAGLAQVEWRLDVPVPAIPLGSFASTGSTMVVAPFLSAGYAGRPIAGLPWAERPGFGRWREWRSSGSCV